MRAHYEHAGPGELAMGGELPRRGTIALGLSTSCTWLDATQLVCNAFEDDSCPDGYYCSVQVDAEGRRHCALGSGDDDDSDDDAVTKESN